jgi:hypothetical protein
MTRSKSDSRPRKRKPSRSPSVHEVLKKAAFLPAHKPQQESFDVKFPDSLRKDQRLFSEEEAFMFKHFTRVWNGVRKFDMPGKIQQCNCVMVQNTLFLGSTVPISHAYGLIDRFMATNFPFF